jgi:hypothetical protein
MGSEVGFGFFVVGLGLGVTGLGLGVTGFGVTGLGVTGLGVVGFGAAVVVFAAGSAVTAVTAGRAGSVVGLVAATTGWVPVAVFDPPPDRLMAVMAPPQSRARSSSTPRTTGVTGVRFGGVGGGGYHDGWGG